MNHKTPTETKQIVAITPRAWDENKGQIAELERRGHVVLCCRPEDVSLVAVPEPVVPKPGKMNLQTKIEGMLNAVLHGWCSPSKAQALAATVMALRPKTVVEIGTYAGRSFLPMAMALQEIGSGTAIGIDPYEAEVSAGAEVGPNKDWWGSFDHKIIEEQFHAAIDALEVRPFVKLMRSRSDDVQPPDGIGLLHVDGAHTEQALRDVQRFAQNVDIGGFVCLDDILWDSGMVNLAAQHLLTLGFVELYRVCGEEKGTIWFNNFAFYQRMDWAAP